MNCEICGKKILGRPTQISIERSLLTVCQECSRFGVAVDHKTALKIERTAAKPGPRKIVPTLRQPRKEGFEESVLVDNFGEVIKKAREAANLTREEFAKKIGEKDSVIRRIEAGEMYPTTDLTKKIERLLKLSLKASVDGSVKGSAPTPNTLTLGDVAILKEGRNN